MSPTQDTGITGTMTVGSVYDARTPDQRIDDLVDRVGKLESHLGDVRGAIDDQAAKNKDLWIKLRQGLLLAAKFIEKVHIRMERYK